MREFESRPIPSYRSMMYRDGRQLVDLLGVNVHSGAPDRSVLRREQRSSLLSCWPMTTLFKHLRIHQIFGANTDVGKTLLTAALVRASAATHKNVFYLKPVSTGPMKDADDE
jgi:hypothetical protein